MYLLPSVFSHHVSFLMGGYIDGTYVAASQANQLSRLTTAGPLWLPPLEGPAAPQGLHMSGLPFTYSAMNVMASCSDSRLLFTASAQLLGLVEIPSNGGR